MRELSMLAPGLADELLMVDEHIGEILRADLETGQVAEVFSSMRETSGKMLRPALLLLAARYGPLYPQRQQSLAKLAALLELVHMASLIHDDIVDDSPWRRGQPATQARFGKDMAVYAGDFLLSRVVQQLFKDNLREAGLIISLTIEEMCLGELGQLACRWDTQTTISSYLQNIYRKSAALFVTACRLGALESGASRRQADLLAAIGEDLGYMFQLRDDVLDFLTPEQEQGHSAPPDFAAGVYTLPLLYALANSPQAERLRQLVTWQAQPPQHEELRQLVRSSGGLDFTQAQLKNHATRALGHLAQLPSKEGSAAIGKMIEWLTAPLGTEKPLLKVVK